jgi:hypothetical protein
LQSHPRVLSTSDGDKAIQRHGRKHDPKAAIDRV